MKFIWAIHRGIYPKYVYTTLKHWH